LRRQGSGVVVSVLLAGLGVTQVAAAGPDDDTIYHDENRLEPSAPSATTAPRDPSLTANDRDPLLYHDGVLYVGASDGVTGMDPTTGSVIMHYRTGSPVVTTPAVLRGFDPQPDPPGRLLVGSVDGTLSAFSTSDGSRLWEAELRSGDMSMGGALMIDETNELVAVTAGREVYALDAATGVVVWAAAT
jgi:outer membrane protein assembly factor BamB